MDNPQVEKKEKTNQILKVGDRAPDFELKTDEGEDWRLSNHLGNVVALIFYPQDESMVCVKQMDAVRLNWQGYLQTEATVVGVSKGTIELHRKFKKLHDLPLLLLADEDGAVTEIYGNHWLFPTIFMRTFVIIDANGIIRKRRSMLRAFRPSDRKIINAIYDAKEENT